MKNAFKQNRPIWPVSKEELKKRWNLCKREENIISGIWIVGFFGFLFACVALADFIEQLPRQLEVAFIVLFFTALAANLFFIFKTINDRLRAYHLICPNCSKTINSRRINYIVNHQQCPNCGYRLIKS
jgi:predicted RNA-binding Zn-ribbon protein involved in translation (DUF1610 family)